MFAEIYRELVSLTQEEIKKEFVLQVAVKND